MDQHRFIEGLFYFDESAIFLPENLVDFLPEIAHMMRHLAFLGGLLAQYFCPIIPAQTFNFQQTWKFLSRVTR